MEPLRPRAIAVPPPQPRPPAAAPAGAVAAAAAVDAATARAVLLVRAYETADPPVPAWRDEDAAWATRLARETVPAAAPAPAYLGERAAHALQRLAPRDAAVQALLHEPVRSWPRWAAALPALALGAGLLAERLAPAQRIELLASPVWLLLAWNLVVYLGLGWRVFAGGASAPGWLADFGWSPAAPAAAGPLQRHAADWRALLRPAQRASASALLHLAAAAFAAGLVAGLYLRGLVLDYRAGWQSTFLDGAQVHALLALLLAPASAVSGVAVPGPAAVAAMQIAPGAAAHAPAAAWIHLLAATVLLAAILPRLLLAGLALWRRRRARAAIVLPLHEPYFQRLLHEREGRRVVVQVLTCGRNWPAAALATLRAELHGGHAVEVDTAPAPDVDDETPARVDAAGASERVLLADLAATPEDEVHGRLLAQLRAAAPALPLRLVVDETSFAARFRATPQRLVQRRALWQAFASRHGIDLHLLVLGAGDDAAAAAA